MPLPPPTFTKTKWLAFFADLVAKITHHNVLIVLEACEVIKRLLISRVSVAAFLEQGDLLQHLLDTVGAVIRCEKPPTELDAEMLFSLIQVLQLVSEMMLSIYADGDEYYTLLVVSRAGMMISSLSMALKGGRNHFYFGTISNIAKGLLSLPLTKERKALVLEEGVSAINHVRTLEEAAARNTAIVKEFHDVMLQISISTTGGVQVCAQYMTLVTSAILKRIADQKATAAGGVSSGYTFGSSSSPRKVQDAANNNASALSDGGVPSSIDGAQDLLGKEAVRVAYETFSKARSHTDCFESLNALFCYNVVSPEICAMASTSDEFSHVARFFKTKPVNSLDIVLFRMLSQWFTQLVSTQGITPQLREDLLVVVRESLVPMLGEVLAEKAQKDRHQQHQAQQHDMSSITPNASTASGALSTSAMVTLPLREIVTKSSTAQAVLTFLLAVEPTATEDHIIDWVKKGLLASLESTIENATSLTSILIDAPSTVDGSLSDESYLQCALKSCRSETSILAILAMKFVSELFITRGRVLEEAFPEETAAFAQRLVPHCMKIASNNPSLSVAEPGTIASVVHHIPKCPRAARPTSVGECAILALDAILAHTSTSDGGVEVIDPVQLLRWIPSLSRATRNSVHPHLRAASQRILLRMSTSAAHLVMVVSELPSSIPTANAAILGFGNNRDDGTSSSAPWEAAGSAEWMSHVLSVASTDHHMEKNFSVCETALPLQLLKLITGSGDVSYPNAALLDLLGGVWEQQHRLGPELNITMYPAVAPNGRKSMPLWEQLLQVSSNAQRKLTSVLNKMKPIRTITTDGLARALSTLEDVSVQCAFAAAAARGLSLVLKEFPDFREEMHRGVVEEFMASTYAIPSPAEIALLVGQRFCVSISHPPLLQRSFEDMLCWASELGTVWYDPSAPVTFDELSSEFLIDMATIFATNVISQHCRSRMALFFNGLLQQPHQTPLLGSIDACARDIFVSSLHLQDAPHVQGMRARLVARYAAACQQAVGSGWLHKHINGLKILVATLTVNKQLTATENDMLAVSLSLISSTVSCQTCPTLSKEDTASIVVCLLELLCEGATRIISLRFCRSIATSSEGRRLMLHEMPAADFHSRSLFAKLMSISFGGRISPQESAIGLDAVSTAIGQGGESFSLAVVKLKFVETVETIMSTLDRQRAPIPVGLLRFLASSTLSANVQPVVARRTLLMTLLVDLAQGTDDRGVLALLTLRNLCFHQNCKIQLCQDARVMLVFQSAASGSANHQSAKKAAATLSPTAAPPTRGAHHKSHSTPAAVPNSAAESENILKRQELALSALWALIHNNQRGRSYVRGLLQQAAGAISSSDHPSTPATATNSSLGPRQVKSAKVSSPTAPVSLNALATTLPSFELGNGALRQYEPLMKANLEALQEVC